MPKQLAYSPPTRPKLEPTRLQIELPPWAQVQGERGVHLTTKPGQLRVALSGGIASGKSLVAEIFCLLGAAHIDFDVLARKVVEPDSPGYLAVFDLLGPKFFSPNGQLNRSKLSRLIFKDKSIKSQLEALLHPLIWDLMGAELKGLASQPVVLISVPLLFETGLNKLFSPIVLVFAKPEIQLSRLMGRNRKLWAYEAKRILKSQWPLAAKVVGADYVIDNNGDLGATIRQAGALFRALTEKHL
ncbi:MAG: dephospho-CoA kinase [Candidatus Adiutrix sp.]